MVLLFFPASIVMGVKVAFRLHTGVSSLGISGVGGSWV